MKKVRNLVLFLLLLLSFSRCEKDRVSEEAVTPGSSFTVEQAEAWFGADWQGTVSLKSGHTENTRIGIKPDWCNGFTSQNNEVEVVEVGLLTQGRFDMADEASYNEWVKTKNPKMIRSLTRMVFLKFKKDGRIDQFLMTIVGDKEYHENQVSRLSDNAYLSREKHFSGHIYYHDLTGKFVNGWVYEKGKLEGITFLKEGQSLPTELKMATTCITTTQYTTYVECTDWYRDYDFDGEAETYTNTTCGSTFVATSTFTECPVYFTGLDGTGTSYLSATGSGGANGGYNPTLQPPCNCANVCACGKCKDELLKSGSVNCIPWEVCSCPPEPVIIVSNLQYRYPCGYEVYTSFGNFNNFISSTLQNTFGSSHTFNAVFNGAILNQYTDGDCGVDNESAVRNPDGTLSSANINITINDYVLKNSTKEYIAVTYAHETLHALIRYYKEVDPAKGNELFPIFDESSNYADGEHLTMANLYINQMVDVVRQLNPNMPFLDTKCLAWNGLQGTRAYDLYRYEFDQINGTGAWDRKMSEVNARERNGTSTIGTKCNQQ